MLADPADLDKSFAYAELAIRAGDYEGAIGALERMLIYNPALPRVRLELGVLYFRLGSYAIAKSYLIKAAAGEDVPDVVKKRIAAYLEEIEKRSSRHRFSGALYGGFRYQSNANAGPDGTGVTILGVPATLSDVFTSKNDWNGFLSGAFRHVWDPQHENVTNVAEISGEKITPTSEDAGVLSRGEGYLLVANLSSRIASISALLLPKNA
jgi:tetratricopeptide (TPR) repeat protein